MVYLLLWIRDKWKCFNISWFFSTLNENIQNWWGIKDICLTPWLWWTASSSVQILFKIKILVSNIQLLHSTSCKLELFDYFSHQCFYVYIKEWIETKTVFKAQSPQPPLIELVHAVVSEDDNPSQSCENRHVGTDSCYNCSFSLINFGFCNPCSWFLVFI